jgi:hypothetical protein
VFINVSDKKTTNSRISVKMIQVKAAFVKTTSVKKVAVKKVSIKEDKRILIKKTSNRIIIEVKKIVEKKNHFINKR